MIVIVGETASGKSALAMDLAKRFNGEIICADSRTVYKGMDIGTAKPSLKDQARIKHHGLDLVNPDQKFAAADFKNLADKTINDISKRGKLPIMVGGTGLYIDAVLYDFEFLPKAPSSERNRLKNMNIEQLRNEVMRKSLPMPENAYNPRHLQRVIETTGQSKIKHGLRPNTLILGLAIERNELKRRIETRVNLMLKTGLLREISILSSRYGWDVEAMTGLGYRELKDYSMDAQSLAEIQERIIQSTMNLAKKQRTWFKRNPRVQWFSAADSALAFAENWLIANKKIGQNAKIKIEL